MDALVGTRLGPYEIVARIGAGAMGEVYRAHDLRLGRDVAIKVLPATLADDPEALARFDRESRAVAAINHPNILALHDIGTATGVAYSVTELLEGETLRQRLDAGPVPPRKALEWAAQLALGLAAAHDRGIVHRDLKPDNVFLTHDGRLKILDFGVARRSGPPTGLASEPTMTTQPGVFVGTPAYASPEQVLGEPATPRSDLFAFGVVLYELLTGTQPFRRETVVDTMTAILKVDPPPLAGAVPGIPTAALRVIDSCLEKQPSERPSSARDVAMFLDASANTSVEAGPELVAANTGVLASGAMLRALAASCGLVLLVLAAAWLYLHALSDRTVNDTLAKDLARAQALATRVHAWRLERLQLTARLLASFPELKALFESTDAATIRDFLVTYQQRNPGTPLLIALGPSGIALGRTDTSETAGTSGADGWLTALTAKQGEPTVVSVGGRSYHAATAAAEAGEKLFGYIVAAVAVDQEFARAVSEATGDETVMLSDKSVLASTFTGGVSPWPSLEQWRRQGGRTDRASMVDVGTRRFAAREVTLSDAPAVSAIVARSRDEDLEPFRSAQTGLLVIGLLAAATGLAAGLWLSRSVRVGAH
jgi:hypothetical protein